MTITIAVEKAPLVTDSQGVVRVANTRVTLDTVVTAFLELNSILIQLESVNDCWQGESKTFKPL